MKTVHAYIRLTKARRVFETLGAGLYIYLTIVDAYVT